MRDPEILEKVMKIFSDREVYAQTAQLFLTISDICQLIEDEREAAFTRGIEQYQGLPRD